MVVAGARESMAIEERVERGESPEEARAAAMREMGNAPLIEDVTRETWGWLWLERVLKDVAYAFRQIRRSPGFHWARPPVCPTRCRSRLRHYPLRWRI